MSLDDLCARCCITRYEMALWLNGATLRAPHLFITGGPDVKAWIEKHYLAKFREHIPNLELMGHALKPERKATKFPSVKAGPWRDALDFEG